MKHRISSARGFSLIEVIVAMGIVATVMVGLIGIMPAGVESLHDAATTAIQSRIVQELVSDAQQSDWNNLPPPPNTPATPKLDDLMGKAKTRYYDSQGTLITPTSAGTRTASYATLMEYADNEEGHKAKVLNYTKGYTHLRRVKITIEFTPGGRSPVFTSNDPARVKYIKTYAVMIANMGTSEFSQ